jgi:hypothetical protein
MPKIYRSKTLFSLALLAAALAGTVVNGKAQTITVSNLWSISTTAGRPYVTGGSTERGVAYNPVNNHVYIVSRAAAVTLKVAIVDGDTGADLGALSVAGITGGTFAVSTITVADDGVIYAANLTTGSATTPYKIYRWNNEASTPAVVYAANPSGGANNNRYGDCALNARGSGIDTELITTAQSNPIAVIFKPTDATLTTFTSTRIDVTGINAADLTKGTGWGPTNTFYGKNSGNTIVRFCSYNIGAGTGALLSTYNVDSVAAFDVDASRNILASADCANNTTTHNLRVYNLASGTTPTSLYTSPFPTPYAANANAVGEVQIAGDRIVAIDTANGVTMAKIYVNNNPVSPSIPQQPPTNTTVIEGGYVTLSMGANGTAPLGYQWFYDESPIEGANTNFLNLTNVSLSQTGRFTIVVTNSAGAITSAPSLLTITPSIRTPVLTPVWNLAPGAKAWLTTDSNQRSIAYNPLTGHLLVVSRTPVNAVYILDAATGAEVGTLNVDLSVIKDGTFPINYIGVAADGSIYAANLTTGTGTHFKVYRWAFEDTVISPTVVFDGDPVSGSGGTTSVRWGDNMDVRTSASGEIQILVASRNGNKAALISSADNGNTFTASTITTEAPDGAMGLGVAFGAGDTFWAKAPASALRQIDFTGKVLHVYGTSVFPSLIGPIAVDPANNYLAGLAAETPDSVRLYNIADLVNPPLYVDTEFFPIDNANTLGTGAADFGGGLLFVLDSNNGLMAFAVQAPPVITCPADKTVECGADWTFDTPTATDPCDGPSVAIIVANTVTNALCGNTFKATRTWKATNSCGNVAQCSQTVTVVDTTAPSIACSQDKVVECGTQWTFDAPIATDSCGTATNVVVSTITNALCGNTFSATRTWQAIDACGNSSANCSQTVTVMDTTAPAIACSNNKSVECGSAWTFVAPTATDCDPNATIAVVSTVTNALLGSEYSVTRTWVAQDACGNQASCSQTVTVKDTTLPVISLVGGSSMILECHSTFTEPGATAADTCAGDLSAQIVRTGTVNANVPGEYVLHYNVNDPNGNVGEEVTRTVIVSDTVAPAITCPENITNQCSGIEGTTVTFSTTATDACDANAVVVCTPASGSSFSLGTTPVSCEATDASGNRSTCSFSVTIVDPSSAPSLTIEQQGNEVVISWPESCTSYVLKETATLTTPSTWSTSSATIETSNGRKAARVTNDGGTKFFRLEKP